MNKKIITKSMITHIKFKYFKLKFIKNGHTKVFKPNTIVIKL